jgi:hypothetical protein
VSDAILHWLDMASHYRHSKEALWIHYCSLSLLAIAQDYRGSRRNRERKREGDEMINVNSRIEIELPLAGLAKIRQAGGIFIQSMLVTASIIPTCCLLLRLKSCVLTYILRYCSHSTLNCPRTDHLVPCIDTPPIQAIYPTHTYSWQQEQKVTAGNWED